MVVKSKIKRGDQVRVMTGKQRGRQGKVLAVMPRESKLIIEGVNLMKRHTKLRQARGRQAQEGGIIEKEAAIQISNVQIMCPSCGPSRIGYQIYEDGRKARVCRKCNGEI